MGHTRTSTTNRFYRRVDRRHQQDAAGRLENLLRQAGETVATGSVTGTPSESDNSNAAG